MIRRPLRPLARILAARAQGTDPDLVEAEERAARVAACQIAERKRAETRLILLGLAFLLGFSTVAGRMAFVSAAEPDDGRNNLAGDGIEEQRAEIVDRNGRLLATNLTTYSLYAQPEELIDPRNAADALAGILPEVDADELYAKFASGRKFLWVQKTISPEQRQAVHDIGEPGLLFGPRQTRLYPNGPVAAHVLGGSGFGREGVRAAEIIGNAGVEREFDERLRDPQQLSDPLRLSLDIDVQIALEDVLAAGMSEMNARGAAGILMDADTGQIRAMASLPEFDPNFRPDLPVSGDPADSPLFNRAAQGRYELGSTFKPITIALALESGLVAPQTLVDTKGPMRWGRFTIRDYKNYGPHLSVEDVIVKSSNIGTARIAIEQGSGAQKNFLGRLGFLEPVPVELSEAARTKPLLPRRWSDLTTMTVSYGHGIAITPLHLAAAYASIANGGYRVTPSIVEDATIEKTSGERVISERTSRQVREMMRQVVVRGTARRADVEGYEIAGKTGTADKPKPGGGYARDRVISTFASFFPADDPDYVLVVVLDEPETVINKTRFRTAGLTAAPVAAEVVERIAPILGMRPRTGPDGDKPALYTLAGNQ